MEPVEEIRRQRLAQLIAEAGSQTNLALQTGKAQTQISNWLRASLDSRGKQRVVSRQSARQLEQAMGKPEGWMDQPTEPLVFGYHAEPLNPKNGQFKMTLGVDTMADLVQPRTRLKHARVPRMSGSAGTPVCDDDVVLVPLMSATGSMGRGNELLTEEVILGDVPMSCRWLDLHVPGSRHEALRMIHAYGDSMSGTLDSGDFAIVDTDKTSADVDGVYVLEVGSLLFIKRITHRLDGTCVISSDNPKVKNVEVLDGQHQVRICGRVVYGWNGRRF